MPRPYDPDLEDEPPAPKRKSGEPMVISQEVLERSRIPGPPRIRRQRKQAMVRRVKCFF